LRFRVTFRVGHQDANPPHLTGLLPPRRERPRGRRTTNKLDELTPLHVLHPSSGNGILTPQTSALIGAEIDIKTIPAVHNQCR
jgi:hypothetical protein